MSTAIFVAIRNSLAREGFCRILTDSDFDAIEPLKDLSGLIPAWTAPYDNTILVVDRSLCGTDSGTMLASVVKGFPHMRIVVLVDAFDFTEMVTMYSAGVHAYFLINSPCQSLVAMMQMVAIGQKVAPPELIDRVDQMLLVTNRVASRTTNPAACNFNERELEVLASLRDGLQNKTIAHDLNLSEASIKATVKSILTKLGARNRTQAAVMAREISLC